MILNNLRNIIFINKFLYPSGENMGSSETHVKPNYKQDSTYFYYNSIKNHINNINE